MSLGVPKVMGPRRADCEARGCRTRESARGSRRWVRERGSRLPPAGLQPLGERVTFTERGGEGEWTLGAGAPQACFGPLILGCSNWAPSCSNMDAATGWGFGGLRRALNLELGSWGQASLEGVAGGKAQI